MNLTLNNILRHMASIINIYVELYTFVNMWYIVIVTSTLTFALALNIGEFYYNLLIFITNLNQYDVSSNAHIKFGNV